MKRTTLCYIEKDGAYLMLHRIKKAQDDNAGKWIGIGGKFEEGESAEECVLREVKEETGLVLTKYRARGVILFESDLYETEEMYLYTASEYTGELTDCDEGVLAWVKKEEVLHLNLWEGDREFLRLLSEDAPYFTMHLTYRGECLADVTYKILTESEKGESDK